MPQSCWRRSSNIRSGAVPGANVLQADSDSLSLLQAVGFNGTTATTMSAAQATAAPNSLASFLDNYNNGVTRLLIGNR